MFGCFEYLEFAVSGQSCDPDSGDVWTVCWSHCDFHKSDMIGVDPDGFEDSAFYVECCAVSCCNETDLIEFDKHMCASVIGCGYSISRSLFRCTNKYSGYLLACDRLS